MNLLRTLLAVNSAWSKLYQRVCVIFDIGPCGTSPLSSCVVCGYDTRMSPSVRPARPSRPSVPFVLSVCPSEPSVPSVCPVSPSRPSVLSVRYHGFLERTLGCEKAPCLEGTLGCQQAPWVLGTRGAFEEPRAQS